MNKELKKITAYSEDGTKTWTKTISIKEGTPDIPGNKYCGPIISFGEPCEYYIKSLISCGILEREKLYIDAGGRNHGVDGGIYVLVEDFKELLQVEPIWTIL